MPAETARLARPLIAKIFLAFEVRYRGKWTGGMDSALHREAMASEWGRILAGLEPWQVEQGLMAWRSAWPPDVFEFLQACLRGEEDVPPVDAVVRMLTHDRPKGVTVRAWYVHPLALAMAREGRVDVFALRSLPAERVRRAVEPVYRDCLERLGRGEAFAWPAEVAALEDRSGRPVTPAERAAARSRGRGWIGALRAALHG